MHTRNPSLDVLRGIAVLLVILFHVDVPVFNRCGWIGVDLFFVLSGFLISELLFRDYEKFGRIRLGQFWLRRAFKILPPLYVFLMAMAALMLSLHNFTEKAFASAAFFYSNYLPNPNSAGSLVGHTWSLAIEEHFYLTVPLLLTALIALSKKSAPFTGITLIFAALAISCFIFRLRDPGHYAFTHMRVDALFAGVMLRYIQRYRSEQFIWFSRPYALVLGLGFFTVPLIPMPNPAITNAAGFAASYLTASLLVGWSFSHDTAAVWSLGPFRALAKIGLASYSIYLWQQPICLLAKEIAPGWFFRPCGTLFSILLGMAMARLIEIPALTWREKVFARAKPDLPPTYCDAALSVRQS